MVSIFCMPSTFRTRLHILRTGGMTATIILYPSKLSDVWVIGRRWFLFKHGTCGMLMDLQEQQNSSTFKVVIRSYMSEELCWAAGPSPLIVVFSLSCVCCCAVQLPNFFILIFLNSTFRKKNKCLFKSWAWTCLKAGPFGGFILKARQFTSEG